MRPPGRSTLEFLVFAVRLSTPVLYGQLAESVKTVTVPAKANPYLAGMPLGTPARFNDSAPDESPVLVELPLLEATAVSFRASGGVDHGPFHPSHFDMPNGSAFTDHSGGAEHGIANIFAPINALVGVFLDDERPDQSRPPKALNLRRAGRNLVTVSPQLKQVFFIGDGSTKPGVTRRFLVPNGATRLFLGTMDGYSWWNNRGSFSVDVKIERAEVTSNMFSVDSQISFAEWACLPDRSQCTPDRPIIKKLSEGQYHVILPAQSEWGVNLPAAADATVRVSGATGMVCLDSQSRSTSSCNGPVGSGTLAGPGFLAPEESVGALVHKRIGDRVYLSVNDRIGVAFQRHEGYFEFDLTVK